MFARSTANCLVKVSRIAQFFRIGRVPAFYQKRTVNNQSLKASVHASASADLASHPVNGHSHSLSHTSPWSRPKMCQVRIESEPTLTISRAASEDPQQWLQQYKSSVVKVSCVHSKPNFSQPWQRKQQYTSTSSGFMMITQDGQQIVLTNAHSVAYHTQVKLKRHGSAKSFVAEVQAIGTDCDLAILTVADPAFWDGAIHLEFGPLPTIQESVYVLGYPVGGVSMSVTTGIVSRIEMSSYVLTSLLTIQVDAAINSGNSGGPVFNTTGQVVGVSFSTMIKSKADGIGYLVPAAVVTRFLVDWQQNGAHTGFPASNFWWQKLESPSMREALGLLDDHTGVMVTSTAPTSHAASVLQERDVILEIDGIEVSSDGTIPFRNGDTIDFAYQITKRFVGDQLPIRVLRNGNHVDVQLKLERSNYIVPAHMDSKGEPSFLIVGGLVFTVCTDPYIRDEFGSGGPAKLLVHSRHGLKNQPDDEVVVLMDILPCAATEGYENYCTGLQILAVNGTQIRNLKHMAELISAVLQDPDGPRFLEFGMDSKGLIMVVKTQLARSGTQEVLATNHIRSAMSRDLEAHLEALKAGDRPGTPTQEVEGDPSAKL